MPVIRPISILNGNWRICRRSQLLEQENKLRALGIMWHRRPRLCLNAPLEAATHETFGFEEIVGTMKSVFAHSINTALNRTGQVWQDESFDHVVRHGDWLEKKTQYVRDNPVRKGLVTKPEDYKWLWEEEKPPARAPVPHGHGSD